MMVLTWRIKKISSNGKFEYNLNSILSRLIYTRILFPGSKLNAFEESKKFIEDPEFDLHQIYRALDVLNKESDYIQSQLYKNSTKVTQRNASVLYYDCTNYFFEIEEADDEGEEAKAEINLDDQSIAEDFIDSAVEDELDSLD